LISNSKMTAAATPNATVQPAITTLAPSRGAGLRRRFWPVAVAALIFFASSREHVASPGITRIDDKFGHFVVYGLLGTLVCRLGSGRRSGFWSLVVVAAYGASDEWHQSFVPGRSMELNDWIADTAGAALAIGLYWGWGWYRRVLESPLRRRPVD
jgi:VanZ family protein